MSLTLTTQELEATWTPIFPLGLAILEGYGDTGYGGDPTQGELLYGDSLIISTATVWIPENVN